MNPSLEKSPSVNPEHLQEGPFHQVLRFILSNADFGLELAQAREILRVGGLARMPKAPRFLEGILSLRGQVVPVVDLRKRFGFPVLETTHDSRIIIVETDGQTLGLLADKVLEVVRFPQGDLLPPSGSLLTLPEEFLSGIVELKGRTLLLLDLNRLFSPDGGLEPSLSGRGGPLREDTYGR